jgi:hypothetical protein
MKNSLHQTLTKHKKTFTSTIKSSAGFLFKGNINVKIIGFLFVFAFSVLVSCNSEEPTDMEPQIEAPSINASIPDFSEHIKKDEKVGTITTNATGLNIIEGGDLFKLGNKNGAETEILAAQNFDFEDGNNAHTLKIEGTLNGQTKVITINTNEIDQIDIVTEAVNRPDVTYTLNDAIGGATLTRDISYIWIIKKKNQQNELLINQMEILIHKT